MSTVATAPATRRGNLRCPATFEQGAPARLQAAAPAIPPALAPAFKTASAGVVGSVHSTRYQIVELVASAVGAA